MRIGLSAVGALGDPHRLDAFGDDHARHLLDVLEEFLEPAFEVEAVPQHEVGRLRPHDIERRRLIIVDLGARLGDRFHDRLIAGDVLRDVLNDRERGHDPKRLARRGLRLCRNAPGPRRRTPPQGLLPRAAGSSASTSFACSPNYGRIAPNQQPRPPLDSSCCCDLIAKRLRSGTPVSILIASHSQLGILF